MAPGERRRVKMKGKKETSKGFEIPRYNYCDYRCEECDYAKECRVYREDVETKKKHVERGEDPNDMDIVMQDLAESFKKTRELLGKSAKKWGIDLEKVVREAPEIEMVEPETFPLYRLAHSFTMSVHEFLGKVREEYLHEEMIKDFEDLQWHHTLVSVKLARAFSSKHDEICDDELNQQDAMLSASVSMRSANKCEGALNNMIDELPGLFSEVADLLSTLKEIKEGIEKEFPDVIT
jgi:hypothetical protein